jgi:hypothetical protein
MELLKDRNAFLLLTWIALRANRTSHFNIHGLSTGEAFLGDYENYGMSRQEYRTAIRKLNKYGFATFKTTNKGTIARLVDTGTYDINAESQQPAEQPIENQQITAKQPLNNHGITTNKKTKNNKNEKKKKEMNWNGASKANRVFAQTSNIGEIIET